MKETQELFNYFVDEYNITLLESDLQEVINIVNRINEVEKGEFLLLTDKEIEAIVLKLGKESTAPDKDTPDWMLSDIKRGMLWMQEWFIKQD